ncbi:MAG: DUF3168 domain-containing protein [Dinoroseobacter sp.]|nr:DUF3168 domain-containing protein [Dinoroseobacter sp.]MDJ0992611.1 DUF3168 domain-containing protein [Dinoroseobacter sp.]
MSYVTSAPLQAALYQRLADDPALSTLLGGAIYDQVPAGTLPATYVTLGPETAVQISDSTGRSSRHDFTVSVTTDARGFQTIKDVAGAVVDALQDAPLSLAQGRLSALDFRRAKARRVGNGVLRQIDLRFRARVDLD